MDRQRSPDVLDWLLGGDPAIRWQVMRDLTHEPADVVAAERAEVATEGWGARLLSLTGPSPIATRITLDELHPRT